MSHAKQVSHAESLPVVFINNELQHVNKHTNKSLEEKKLKTQCSLTILSHAQCALSGGHNQQASAATVRKTVKKTTFAKRVKNVVMKASETKRINISWTKIELYHNVLSLSQMLKLNDSTIMPQVGSRQIDRIGDRINSIGWTVRMLLGQKGDRPNVNWGWFCITSARAR